MLTMEQTFIVTGVAILIIGAGLGLLLSWLLGYFKKEDADDDPNE